MADDVNPSLRAELETAKALLEPQIRGLHDLAAVSISGDLRQEVSRQIEIRERRRGLINTLLSLLDSAVEARGALERDGYPDVEGSRLSDSLFAELRGEKDDLASAVSLFEPDAAENLSVRLGASASKPIAS